MSCCGKKRMDFLNELSRPSTKIVDHNVGENSKRENNPKLFEYTGLQNLTIKNTNTGTIYRFKYHGDKVEVAYEDSFSMMAENQVIPVRK